jgi:formate dehydrogenase major subunit
LIEDASALLSGLMGGNLHDRTAMIRVRIDGRDADVPAGASILEALRGLGISVPALCHDDRLTPTGACRSCLVQVSGSPRLVPACATPVADGMAVETGTPELEEHRRSLLQLLAWRYPADAMDAAPGKPFHQHLCERGLQGELAPAAATTPTASMIDRSHPYIAVDMRCCIECLRCVRICDEVQGQGVWHVRNRGLETQVVPDGPTLRDSSCVGCGACVDTCPTAALSDAATRSPSESAAWTRTTCPYCGVGCELSVGTCDGRIVGIRPVLDALVSKGHLCVKGRYAFEFVGSADRVTQPMIRGRNGWRPVSWATAADHVARRLGDLIARHGADAIGVLGSARATNEDNYLLQKLARTVIGTNNVDCCARVCHAPSAAALKRMLGVGLGTNSFDDIERASTILVYGANPTEDHPIVGARIRQAARRGARLIVIDPRRIELTQDAACHLAVVPGTDVLAKACVTRRF